MLLVETTNGRKFGGYTTCVWSVNKGGKKDGKTFLFSLDEKKLYKKKKEHANERDNAPKLVTQEEINNTEFEYSCLR